jgi:DNA mismatch repair protein MutL
MILNAPAVADVKTRVTQIWGNNVSQNLLELCDKKSDEKWVSFTGYISNHNFWRYGKTHIFLFVNNRWVKNVELSKALFKGYLNVLPPDKSPAAFIFTEIDKNLVDINCHPKKEEVRFLKPLSVQTKLQEVVKFTLEANVSAQLSSQMVTQKNFTPEINKFFTETVFAKQDNKIQDFVEFDNANFINSITHKNSVINYKQIEVEQAQANLQFDEEANKNEHWKNFKIIGQLFKTYIMLEHGDDLIIIDQHAAHERILYEKMLKNFEKKDGVCLIFPEILKLTAYQLKLLTEQQIFLQNQGIEFEVFGEAEIAIKSGPVGLAQASLKELILEIINFVEENEHFDQEEFRKKLNEHMHSHLACKLAIKAGDQLSEVQMENLLQELQKTEKRFICVHGRPTTWTIKKYDLEKNFRRR